MTIRIAKPFMPFRPRICCPFILPPTCTCYFIIIREILALYRNNQITFLGLSGNKRTRVSLPYQQKRDWNRNPSPYMILTGLRLCLLNQTCP